MVPFYRSLSMEYDEAASFVEVDIDEVEDAVEEMGITSMPTFVVLKGDEQIGRVNGADEKRLEELLSWSLPSQ